VRRVLDGERLDEVHPLFLEHARHHGYYSEALMEAIAETGSVRALDDRRAKEMGVPDEARRRFATAHDVEPIWHLRMQAVFQKHVDNAVSKTINCPRDTPPEEVASIFHEAYRLGCKGVTVFRDGSRAGQVLAFGEAAVDGETIGVCPECGAEGNPVHQGSCALCVKCGYSACA
jgi:ribonucleoside-diphosphate reductase alpha chain